MSESVCVIVRHTSGDLSRVTHDFKLLILMILFNCSMICYPLCMCAHGALHSACLPMYSSFLPCFSTCLKNNFITPSARFHAPPHPHPSLWCLSSFSISLSLSLPPSLSPQSPLFSPLSRYAASVQPSSHYSIFLLISTRLLFDMSFFLSFDLSPFH